MHLTQIKMFNSKEIEQFLIKENQFIKQLFSIASLPTRNSDNIEENPQETQNGHDNKIVKVKETTRARSLSELQQRLVAITSKKTLTYKEKLTKKSLKNRIKKNNKRDERNAARKLTKAQELSDNNVENPANSTTTTTTTAKTAAKPVFNSEGKLVFSKFDFSSLGQNNEHHKKLKKKHEPKKVLENLEKQKVKLTELEEAGEISKVIELKEKSAWANALAKAEGQKIKDDPILLKKTVQRQEQKKRSSRKKWEIRQKNVEKAKDERQRKRKENIEKRKKDKKTHKLKRAAKKGRIIPGF